MAERRSTTVITTVEKSETPSQNNNPFCFLSLIPKFLLKPFENLNKNEKTTENGKSVKKVEKQQPSDTKTPDAVKFPRTKNDVSGVKLESEDVQQDTNPLILWQVYALGGFIILKWAWGKWQEKKENAKKDSGEEQPPPPASESAQGSDPPAN